MMTGLALTLHLLGAVVWVGGMFFAHMALRPVAAAVLEPPQRLTLLAGVFSRFFPWVWLSIVLLLSTGLYLVGLLGGFGSVAVNVHIMTALGFLMVLIYCFIYFVLFSRLKAEVKNENWKAAGAALGSIRKLIAVNLGLGLAIVAIARLGAVFG
jgi:uncharacterized membrane protein